MDLWRQKKKKLQSKFIKTTMGTKLFDLNFYEWYLIIGTLNGHRLSKTAFMVMFYHK